MMDQVKQENKSDQETENVCLTDKDCILPNEYTPKGKYKRRVLMDNLMKLRVEKNDQAAGQKEFQERAISALLRRLRNHFTSFPVYHFFRILLSEFC